MAPLFNDRDDYLFWRSEWRAEYRQLSARIRDLKWYLRTDDRLYSLRATPAHPRYPDAHALERLKSIQSAYPVGFFVPSLLHRFQRQATDMLEMRKQSKQLAQAQYLSARQTQAVPA